MKKILFLTVCIFMLASCGGNPDFEKVSEPLAATIISQAETDLSALPITVTEYPAERSEGTIHDFFSEGDYWWPNPADPEGPYIRRDGETNPDNFVLHRHAMIRFSQIVANLTSAYLLTGDQKYADAVVKHVNAWFIDESTMMSPHLLYAQAIKGVTTGRGIGIIDTIHLVEVAQSLIRLEEAGAIPQDCIEGCKKWFSDYLTWISTHPNGIEERNAKNNHSVCWVMQAAAFAKLTDNQEIMALCREKFKKDFVGGQMALDGSFPQELERTKPYGYSLFNLDAMAGICQILSTEEDDLWKYTSEDGKNMSKAIEFMLPYIQDKRTWPYGEDVMYWDEWPVAQPTLIFAWKHFRKEDYFKTWLPLNHFPENDEVIRNLPLRNPLIWM